MSWTESPLEPPKLTIPGQAVDIGDEQAERTCATVCDSRRSTRLLLSTSDHTHVRRERF